MSPFPSRAWRWSSGRVLVAASGLAVAAYLALVARAIIWPVHAELPVLPEPREGQPVLVIAPHEDDETLGCGAYMRAAVASGVPVWVCLVTFGEGEELGRLWATKHPVPSARQFVKLGKIRQQETLRALQSIGVPQNHVIFLGYPNMGLRWMWSARYWSPKSLWRSPFTKTDHSPFDDSLTPAAPFCGAAVLHDLKAVMERVQPRFVFCTHPADIHPDHWATYCFTRLALEELRARPTQAWAQECELFTYLVHRRGWPSPWGYYPELKLAPPPALVDLPLNHWVEWPLTPEQTRAKNRMVLTYRSQAAAFDLLLRAFARRNELFAALQPTAPGREFSWLSTSDSREPRGETAYLRLHLGADIVGVQAIAAPTAATVEVRTAAPLTRVHLVVLITAVGPSDGAVRSVSVALSPKHAPEVWASTDREGPRQPPAQVWVATAGTTTTVSVPTDWTGSCGKFLVDAMTLSRTRIVDHAMTRFVVREPDSLAAVGAHPEAAPTLASR